MTPRSALALLLLPLLLGVTSCKCSSGKLRQDLETLHTDVWIVSGRLTVEAAADGQPVVLLARTVGESQPVLVDYRFPDGQGRFNFQVAEGDYRLMAFVDTDRDYRYQVGEPTAVTDGLVAHNTLSTPDAEWATNRLTIVADARTLPFEVDITDSGLAALERPVAVAGAPLDMRDPRFDKEAIELGMWRPMRFLHEVGYGLYSVEPATDPNSPHLIVMVHGINGSPRDFEWLSSQLDIRGARVALFHYPSGMRIHDNAYMLAQTINDLSVRHPGQAVTVIAHSMGGLVARRFIQIQREAGGAREIKAFISISTPWAGHKMAQLGVDYARTVVPVWRDMAPSSEFLESLYADALPDSIDYTLLFSHSGHSMFLGDANDGVVFLESQLFPPAQDRADRLVGVNRDHVGILNDRRTVDTINEVLREIVR